MGISWLNDDAVVHAFLYRNGHMRDLGEFNATSINDRSEVIGWASTPDGNHAVHYRSGKLRDLGTLAGADTYPNAINNCGEVVGEGVAGTGLHAFVHFKDEFLDLNSVLPAPLARHVELETASAINDRGQIVARGVNVTKGEWRKATGSRHPPPVGAPMTAVMASIPRCYARVQRHPDRTPLVVGQPSVHSLFR